MVAPDLLLEIDGKISQAPALAAASEVEMKAESFASNGGRSLHIPVYVLALTKNRSLFL